MTYEFQEASIADAGELASLMSKAYADEPTMSQLMPPTSRPDALDDFWAGWLREDMPKPGEEMIKVVDTDTGKIIAFAKTHYPTPKGGHSDLGIPPEGINIELLHHWFEVMDKYKERHMDSEKDIYFHILSVDPSYHRQGLGGKLLRNVCAKADKGSWRIYLQATVKGAGLYRRLGFEDVEECTFQTPKGLESWMCMMREPQVAETVVISTT